MNESNITLDENIEISSIKKLYAKLEKCANRKVNVNLHANKVAVLDTAGIQMLASFVTQINQNGNSITWHEPSQQLLTFSEYAGLTKELELLQ